jgi:3-hydroxybutyryl-CoA dehydrogenase
MSKIVALGAGRMGRGIGHVFAYAGHDVTILDFKPREAADAQTLLAEAEREIADNLGFLCTLGLLNERQMEVVRARISFAALADAEAVCAAADVVFEGVTEKIDAKQEAFTLLSGMVSDTAIIASTTSTIAVDELAEHISRPERFLNAHWLNPAFLIPLVEVSPGSRTDPVVLDQMMALLRSVGKTPVQCKASPGYIVPRIQAVAMNEAARMIEEGVATAEDIDTAIRTGFGVRYATMGLVEFIDWGGLDILYYASHYLAGALGSDRYAPPAVVNDLMEKGDIGLSSGKGFYDFTGRDADAFRREKLSALVSLLRYQGLLSEPVA